MTFENEEGANRAMNFNKAIEADTSLTELGTWLGKYKIVINQAAEPSDIIWENRHFTPWERAKKKLIVVLLMIVMLALSFGLLFACATFSLNLLKKFPDVPCHNLPENDSSSNLQKAAIREWSINHALAKQGVEVSYAGYV